MDDLSRLSNGKIIPAELLEVLKRMSELYADKLQIASLDAQWATVQARDVTETHLLKSLMENEKQLFTSNQLSRFQVLCPWDYRGGRGLHLGYFGYAKVPPPGPGFWWV